MSLFTNVIPMTSLSPGVTLSLTSSLLTRRGTEANPLLPVDVLRNPTLGFRKAWMRVRAFVCSSACCCEPSVATQGGRERASACTCESRMGGREGGREEGGGRVAWVDVALVEGVGVSGVGGRVMGERGVPQPHPHVATAFPLLPPPPLDATPGPPTPSL